MRNLLRDLRSAWWQFLKPAWDEPDENDVSPAAFRQWVAGHKHPDQCNRGCQCGQPEGGG